MRAPEQDIARAPAGGTTSLPFTGPGDMLVPTLLALLAVMGGSMLFMYASAREVAVAAAQRSLRTLSGFAVVHNDIEREGERAA